MKLFIYITAAILLTGRAYAQPVWVKTPFWQTAYIKAQTVKLKAEARLDDACDDYSALVNVGAGGTGLSAGEIEILRSNSPSITSRVFNAIFVIDKVSTNRLITQSMRDVSQEVSAQADKDALPNFTLQPAEVTPFDRMVGSFSVDYTRTSLSAISHGAGLQPLKIEVASYFPEIKIRVYGLDTVCDLHRGKASLITNSTGLVKIPLEIQLKLSEFYRSIEEATDGAFKRTQGPMGRMALLGFKLAPVIKSADAVETLVNTLFDDKGERNGVWTLFDGSHRLSVSGSVPVQFQLRMER